MSEESKIRDTAEAVKGIVEAVPVYHDVVQPAAREVGTALQTVAKTIHIALAPVSALIWGYDQIKEYLNASLIEKLKAVPQEQIVSPNLNVAGPAIEALRFAAHDPSLRELYANLLATSMDSQTAPNAHPAFVEFIRHMTPDEARILSVLDSQYFFPLFDVRAIRSIGSEVVVQSRFTLLCEAASCSNPHLIPNYLDNLQRMGLVIRSVRKPEIVSLVSLRTKHWTATSMYYAGMNSFKTCETLLQRLNVKDIFGRSSDELMPADCSVSQVWVTDDGVERDNTGLAGFQVDGEKLSLTHLGQQFHDACIA